MSHFPDACAALQDDARKVQHTGARLQGMAGQYGVGGGDVGAGWDAKTLPVEKHAERSAGEEAIDPFGVFLLVNIQVGAMDRRMACVHAPF